MNKLELKPMQLVGLALPHKTENRNGQSAIDIGQLWQKFEREGFYGRIPNRKGDAIYAVYHSYEGDHNDPFSYFIGCEVENLDELPDGLSSLEVPGGSFEKAVAKGPMPACIGLAWQKIWESDMPRAYRSDFEVYDERSSNWEDVEVDIYLSVN